MSEMAPNRRLQPTTADAILGPPRLKRHVRQIEQGTDWKTP